MRQRGVAYQRAEVIRELAELRVEHERVEALEELALAELPLEVESDHVSIPDPPSWMLP